ncbi:MAG: polysaccharide biosynthesis C-terminal domain-containing protein, partial [Clostridia bacterium]|nr:polysaccharide biosynthesis C-terminal domain-containing protein [Clostridia bacterium]
AVATTGAVGYAAMHGSLPDAMIALCVVNAVVLVGYSWVVHRADSAPLTGFLVTSRPMVSAIVMALIVRHLLDTYGHFLPNPVLQLLAGIGIGGAIYCALTLLFERRLLKTLKDLLHKRAAPPVLAAES